VAEPEIDLALVYFRLRDFVESIEKHGLPLPLERSARSRRHGNDNARLRSAPIAFANAVCQVADFQLAVTSPEMRSVIVTRTASLERYACRNDLTDARKMKLVREVGAVSTSSDTVGSDVPSDRPTQQLKRWPLPA